MGMAHEGRVFCEIENHTFLLLCGFALLSALEAETLQSTPFFSSLLIHSIRSSYKVIVRIQRFRVKLDEGTFELVRPIARDPHLEIHRQLRLQRHLESETDLLILSVCKIPSDSKLAKNSMS